MLIKRITNAENREQVLYSLLIRSDNRHANLIVGRKRQIEYHKYEFTQKEPIFIDSVEFSEDILELKKIGQDVLVLLNNLQMYCLILHDDKIEKKYVAVIRSFADTPISRVKHTSCEISQNMDYGLLNAFSNSLVILYFSNKSEEGKEECKEPQSTGKSLNIDTRIKYYDFKVNSSLLIINQGKEGESIWHLNEEHYLVKSPVQKINSSVDVVSDESNLIHCDRTIIDIGYFNKTHIVLMQTDGISFFNLKDLCVSSKLDTQGVTLINLLPLYDGAFEGTTSLIGITSNKDLVHYSLISKREEIKIQKLTPISSRKTNVTSISSCAVNKNRYLVYTGTCFGSPSLSSFSKCDDTQVHIYSFQKNYGRMKSLCMHNNALTFSYGSESSTIDSIESSSNKLTMSCDLSSVLSEIKPSEDSFCDLKICNVTPNLKVEFEKESVLITVGEHILCFLSTPYETYVLILNTEKYCLEVVQILPFATRDAYLTNTHFVLISNEVVSVCTFKQFLETDFCIKDINEVTRSGEGIQCCEEQAPLEIISSTLSEDVLVIYTSARVLSVYKISEGLDKPSYVEKTIESVEISNICLNENILAMAVRSKNKEHIMKYEISMHIFEDDKFRHLYSIPIWAEDLNDKAQNAFFITDLYFGNDVLQYTYNHTLTIQRKGILRSIQKFSKQTSQEAEHFSEDNIFELHRIIYADDSSVKVGETKQMEGTYMTKGEHQKSHIISNVDQKLQVQLTPQQILNVYKTGHKEEVHKLEEEVHVKEFIESSSEISSGCFFVSQNNRVYFQTGVGSQQNNTKLFKCRVRHQIVCASKICKVKDVFGDNSIFDEKYQYVLCVSTKSNEVSKHMECNLVTIGISISSDQSSGNVQIESTSITRTIGYQLITSIYLMEKYKESNAGYAPVQNIPNVILGCVTSLLNLDFKSNHVETDIEMSSQEGQSQSQDANMSEEEQKQATPESTQTRFDATNPDSVILVVKPVRNFSFTWISKILTYNFEEKYLVVHDLMKGISLLNNTSDNFEYHHEKIALIENPILLESHRISDSLFLCQDDAGVISLIGVDDTDLNQSQTVKTVYKKAEYLLKERITCFLSLSYDTSHIINNQNIAFSTFEGNIYTIKILEKEMVPFISKIQFNILKRLTNSLEENEQLLKKYDEGFRGGFSGNLIAQFFDVDLKEVKQLLGEIKGYNLLSLKMLFY
ncbi:unnamed protein product [Moneuplotes crassus]|uniref:Uncharacterized protein n=1 Tax=Euplotes crassus TaxID=5936 RepID=A0AAD1XFW5_EUPCR|nr:unnamed protein product [Moneuplotes crassus]